MTLSGNLWAVWCCLAGTNGDGLQETLAATGAGLQVSVIWKAKQPPQFDDTPSKSLNDRMEFRRAHRTPLQATRPSLLRVRTRTVRIGWIPSRIGWYGNGCAKFGITYEFRNEA